MDRVDSSPSLLCPVSISPMEKKLPCVLVLLASSLVLAATLADAASSSVHPSLNSKQAQVLLGRKGRGESDLPGYHRYRREGKEQHEVASMEVKKGAGLRDAAKEEEEEEGLIHSADYSGVTMHSRSPPAHHKHPKGNKS